MNSSFINATPYLRTSRSFPEDLHEISIEINKAYLDIALSVNARTIGLFSLNKPTITGESWFYDNNQKHQGLRKIFTFTSFANIPHSLDIPTINSFSRNYGEYTDGTNWYGLISGTSVLIPGQVVFYITPTDIVFVQDGSQPSISPNGKGILVLEWLSNV